MCNKDRTDLRVAVTHANSEAGTVSLLEAAQAQLNPGESVICPLGPVIGTHAGSGTIALHHMGGVE